MTRISHSWIRMALVSRLMTGAKYDGQTSRATRSRMVAKVPGIPNIVSQRAAKSAVGVLSIVSMPLIACLAADRC